MTLEKPPRRQRFLATAQIFAATAPDRASWSLYLLLAAVLWAIAGAARAEPVVIVKGLLYCAGVAISPTHVVTNQHCVAGMTLTNIQPRDAPVRGARVLAANSQVDLAVLLITGAQLTPATFGNPSSPRAGAEVTAVGHPNGNNWTITTGTMIGYAMAEGERFLLHSAPVAPGSSGGALYNERGELIGINVGKVRQGSLAIPINVVMEFLREAGL